MSLLSFTIKLDLDIATFPIYRYTNCRSTRVPRGRRSPLLPATPRIRRDWLDEIVERPLTRVVRRTERLLPISLTIYPSFIYFVPDVRVDTRFHSDPIFPVD